jgi:molybdenum cofactor guanylyltransferase
MNSVAAFILSGGKSSRMGSDKAWLELAGKPLIARAVELARQVSDEVKIVGDPQRFSGYAPVVTDIFCDRGPLGGIHAALASTHCGCNLILAVDLPFLNAELLNYLLGEAQASGAVVTVPASHGYFQPLCGVYRKEFASIAQQALAEGNNKIDALFPRISLRGISEPELQANGFGQELFRNLNTREEFEQAKREFGIRSRL